VARLQVAGAKTEDAGKAVARVSVESFQQLGIAEGDVVEILGKRTAAAIALLPHEEDQGLTIIRLDGLERANANVGIGDFV